jgi:hypothetical protein
LPPGVKIRMGLRVTAVKIMSGMVENVITKSLLAFPYVYVA